MFFGTGGPRLSQKSHNKIEQIVQITQQNFPQIEVRKEKGDVYFSQNGRILNRFDFYASMFGAIESIAIYGTGLHDMLRTINQNKIILGLKVEEAEIDSGGMEDYLNVKLVVDSSLEDEGAADSYFDQF